jgi:hypothetical protein
MVTASDTSAHSPRTKESSGHDEIERDSNMGRSNHSPTDSQGDPMDTTPPAGPSMGPPQSSPDTEQVNPSTQGGEPTVEAEDGTNGMSSNHTGTGAPAAASAQQPKVVQTAFIHKLYKLVTPHSQLSGANDPSQHARGPKHTASYFVVKLERGIRNVPFQ